MEPSMKKYDNMHHNIADLKVSKFDNTEKKSEPVKVFRESQLKMAYDEKPQYYYHVSIK